ncbi:MAG: alkaline phosphatase family protein [Acidilobaceae archaeon]
MRIFYIYIVAVILIVLVLSLATTNTALRTYDSWVNYRNPYIDILQRVEPVSVSGEPVARHLVFILLDGLSVDNLESLIGKYDSLRELISMGAFYPNGLANTPTYSIPGRASILTGAPPEVNSVLSNFYNGSLGVDSIARVAKDAGFKILCSGDNSIEMLLSDIIDECSRVNTGGGHGAIALSEGLRLFNKYSNAGYRVFLWVGVDDIDVVGHSTGSRSSEYNATIANIAKLTLNFIESIASNDALIVVLNDHGFKKVGHHGGPELEVRRVFTLFIGPRVKPGVYNTSFTHNDIAPTVAMLMGLRVPALSMGRVLADGFDISTERVEVYSRASREQALRVIDAIGGALGIEISPTADPLDSYRLITSKLYSEGVTMRLVLVLILVAIVLVGFYVSLRVHLLGPRRLLILTVSGLIVYEVTYWLVYFIARGPTSLSDVYSLGELLGKIRVVVMLSSIILGVFLGIVELTPFRVGILRILVPTVTVPALALLLSLIYASPFYISYGSTVRFPPPDWSSGFMFFVYLMKASITGLVGLPIVLVVVVVFSIIGLYMYRLLERAGKSGV